MTIFYAEAPGPSWVQIAAVVAVIAGFVIFCGRDALRNFIGYQKPARPNKKAGHQEPGEKR